MELIFTKTIDVIDDYYPQPSSRFVPDWYKNLDSYVEGEKRPTGKGDTTATIKRCMPVFDSITSGYIIPTYTDIFVTQQEVVDGDTKISRGYNIPWYEWPSFSPLGFHPIQQAPTHPGRKTLSEEAQYPKWNNPWGIKTPPGYSCLFVSPFHRESPFTILPGIVDTDTYTAPVNFPFILNDWTFKGLIPAGTPMAQVIPFKRESWKMSLGEQKDLEQQREVTKKLRTKFFDSYKSLYRQSKEYK